VFDADVSALVASAAPPGRHVALLGSQTAIALALLEDFFADQGDVVRDQTGRIQQSEFIDAFNAWAMNRGSTPQTPVAIGRALRELGAVQGKSNGQRFYLGISRPVASRS
jgi:hypothetical protein